MHRLRKNKISIKKIAKFLNINYTGKDFDITSISSLNDIKNNSILFYSDLTYGPFKTKDIVQYDLKKLEKFENIALIANDKIRKKTNVPILSSKYPRIDFYRVVMEFFLDEEFEKFQPPN